MYQKQHPSLGFQLHIYKFFILLSVYFYHSVTVKYVQRRERERERERERLIVSHTDIYASLILCTEIPTSCIRSKYPNGDKVARTTKKVYRPAPSG